MVRVHNRLSFPEARKLVEMAAPTVADKSYAAAAAPKRATKSVAINTELTWHFSEAKYQKLSDIEKTEKQLQKAAKKQKQKTENKETSMVSLDSKHPSSRSSTGLPGTDKDTRKTNITSDRLKKAEPHLQISNSYQTSTDLRDEDMDYIQTKRTPKKNKNNPHTSPWWLIQSSSGTAVGLGPILMN